MAVLPKFQPMPLTRVREPFDHPDWIFELKYDGYRALAYVGEKSAKLVSRNGNAFRRFGDLAEALRWELTHEAVIDGEVVCLDHDGRPMFNELLFGRGDPCFVAFDAKWAFSFRHQATYD